MSTQRPLTNTRKVLLEPLVVEPIHALPEPVFAYAKQIGELKGEAHRVVTIPEGSSAYAIGYRFTSIPDSELQYFIANGAQLVERH